MLRFLGGCVGRLLGTVLLVALVAGAWYNRDRLAALLDDALGRPPVASEALAERAAAKLARLDTPLAGTGDPEGDDDATATRVAFHEAELQSLIQYRWAGALPDGLARPRIGIGAGRVTLEGDLPTRRLRGLSELREIAGFLPDTAAVRVVGSLVPLDSGHVSLEIHELAVATIPLPERLIPAILDGLRPEGAVVPGPNALAIPLPSFVDAVYVSGDSLVITARTQGGG